MTFCNNRHCDWSLGGVCMADNAELVVQEVEDGSNYLACKTFVWRP